MIYATWEFSIQFSIKNTALKRSSVLLQLKVLYMNTYDRRNSVQRLLNFSSLIPSSKSNTKKRCFIKFSFVLAPRIIALVNVYPLFPTRSIISSNDKSTILPITSLFILANCLGFVLYCLVPILSCICYPSR